MKITRAKTRAHVKIPNVTARDRQLSWKARGILTYLLSHVDEGWTADSHELAKVAPGGRPSVLSGLNELVAAGYIKRRKFQDERGHWVTEVEVFDVAQPVEPKSGFPTSGDRQSADRTSAHRKPADPTLRTEDQQEDHEEAHREDPSQNQNPPTPRAEPTAPASELADVVEDRGEADSDVAEGDERQVRGRSAEFRRLAWQAVAARARSLTDDEQKRIAARILKALHAGFTFAAITAKLDEPPPTDLKDPAGLLIARVGLLMETPPAPDLRDLVECPIGGHFDYRTGQQYRALKCNNCRADVKAGFDPFNGRHDERHPDWPETYGWDPPALDAEDMPLDPAVRADMFAKLAALSARLDMDEALDRDDAESVDAARVGAGEVNPW